MNEASNFCVGACYDDQKNPNSSKYDLRYIPGGRDLNVQSIDIDAAHENGFTELDMHSLFGTMEVRATHGWFQKQNNRTMIIERSAFAGLGKFGSRWLGDNNSSAFMMGASVPGIMMHNIIGIPFAGSDICGFLGNTTAELCARWHILGAFYPFSRNHNTLGANPQEPWVWKDEYYDANSTLTYMDIMKLGVQTKYHMIRYYYTQLSLISQGANATLFKPLFFEYPNDNDAYKNQEQNIMLGTALKLSINSNTLGQDSTDFYFPPGRYCNVFNTHLKDQSCFDANEAGLKGVTKTLSTKAYEFHLHLRDGHIVPFQNATALEAMTTADLQKEPVELHIHSQLLAPAFTDYLATGQYLNDDGVTLDTDKKQNKYDLFFEWNNVKGTFTVDHYASADDYKKENGYPCDGCVNENDQLGMLQIYSGKFTNMNQAFNVKIIKKDKSEQSLGYAAKYDTDSDRLMLDLKDLNVFLPELYKIEFTK